MKQDNVGVLATMLMDHVKRKDLLPKEQKALRKGCLDAPTIDEATVRGPTPRKEPCGGMGRLLQGF